MTRSDQPQEEALLNACQACYFNLPLLHVVYVGVRVRKAVAGIVHHRAPAPGR
eukprot:CAMPEP_0179336328 /NCGR_PEP_ID=MMETSP0797-20121207/66980_1 /TAXON_ID=47934 /ORGANISM="Dinophysis acuminata, Strain DAEP01" /LENGTH=52 /DNA_ID=CAMNT_0021049799 /DNA_START=170 /DNA_END=325 /DNA_ORIENTATION=-